MIVNGNALHIPLADGTVQTCVTSPPYYGLRDYGVEDAIGLEETPEEYIEKMVAVFREVKRVLRDDGTCWVNMGDSYASSTKGSGGGWANDPNNYAHKAQKYGAKKFDMGDAKEKDLMGIPWMLAFALRADGWYLRSEIIWHKPNPMPESVTDRPTKAHEQIFLLSKNARYFYDADAVREKVGEPIRTAASFRNGGIYTNNRSFKNSGNKEKNTHGDGETAFNGRNRRSVWTVATKPYSGAHFATFPPALIEPCILAGSKEGDVVLDPFSGSGTTGEVSIKHRRRYFGVELNREYIDLSKKRTTVDVMLPGMEVR